MLPAKSEVLESTSLYEVINAISKLRVVVEQNLEWTDMLDL